MTIQKQLTHLSFAAIMLVFAALPALAQTGSVARSVARSLDSQTAMVTTSNSDRVAALRMERLSIPTKESTSVAGPAITEKQPTFSATQFTKSVTEPAVIKDSTALEFTSLAKPRFDETSPKALTFVPSRGPKLPWQPGN